MGYKIEVEVLESEMAIAGKTLIRTMREVTPAALKTAVLMSLAEIAPDKAQNTFFTVTVIEAEKTMEIVDPITNAMEGTINAGGEVIPPSTASTTDPTTTTLFQAQFYEEESGSMRACTAFLVSAGMGLTLLSP